MTDIRVLTEEEREHLKAGMKRTMKIINDDIIKLNTTLSQSQAALSIAKKQLKAFEKFLEISENRKETTDDPF